MKYIIDIPESEYQTYLVAHISGMGNSAMERIIDGKLLKDELQEIRQEIEQYESYCLFAEDSKECMECDRVMFSSIYRIIDMYMAESEDEE